MSSGFCGTRAALDTGTHNVSAQYGGDATFAPSTSVAVQQRVNAAAGTGVDFTLQASATALGAIAGANASTTLTVTALNGLTQSVSFTCSGLPAGAACSFAPATVATSAGPANTSLTITTNGAPVTVASEGSGPARGPFEPFPPIWAAAWIALASWREIGAASTKLRLRCGLLMGLLALAGVVACGGSGGGGSGSGAAGGTPAGTSIVTVTATAGSGTAAITHTLDLTLAVTR